MNQNFTNLCKRCFIVASTLILILVPRIGVAEPLGAKLAQAYKRDSECVAFYKNRNPMRDAANAVRKGDTRLIGGLTNEGLNFMAIGVPECEIDRKNSIHERSLPYSLPDIHVSSPLTGACDGEGLRYIKKYNQFIYYNISPIKRKYICGFTLDRSNGK